MRATFKYLLNKEKKNCLKIPLPSAKNVIFFGTKHEKKKRSLPIFTCGVEIVYINTK